MWHVFQVTGFNDDVWQMKSQARRASHKIEGANKSFTEFQQIRFERYDEILNRHLTRREVVFGVKSPDDGQGGGFKGLVNWCGDHVQIDMARAKMVGAGEWVVDFVRQSIEKAGWTITEEKTPNFF